MTPPIARALVASSQFVDVLEGLRPLYGAYLWLFTGLLLGRVLGQLVVAVRAPSVAPADGAVAICSGLLP